MAVKRKCKECGAIGPWHSWAIWYDDPARDAVLQKYIANRRRKWWLCDKCKDKE